MFNSTICSYPERGKWGKNTYRGNCSGKIIEDIITTPCYHILDKTGKAIARLSDYMVGSGTTEEVCRDYKVDGTFLDLNRGFDMMTMDIPERAENIFWHPPYGNMITYSDKMYSAQGIIDKYGFDPRVNDLSRNKDWNDFVKKMNYCCYKQYLSLEKGGRMFILMGDWKQKGKLYSMLVDICKPGTIEQIIIKAEHNCVSDGNTYTNRNFVPIQHEYLLVLRKDEAFLIPCKLTKDTKNKITQFQNATWRSIVAAILESFDRPLALKEIYDAVRDSAKAKCEGNNNVEAKIRQTLQTCKEFARVGEGVYQMAA